MKIPQVLMMRPDSESESGLAERGPHGAKSHGISKSLFDHFRCVQNITCLDKRIATYDKPFPDEDQGRRQEKRARYFQRVCKWIGEFRGRQRIVLVDPDTGIAPTNLSYRHITDEELRKVYDAIEEDDILVLYQHRQHRRDWLDATTARFARAVQVRRDEVRVFQCRELASDVALFATNGS